MQVDSLENKETNTMAKSFNENGYIILKSHIPENYFLNIENSYLELLKKYDRERFGKFSAVDIRENLDFHRSLIKLREETPNRFSAVYDSMTASLSIISLAISNYVIETIEKITGFNKDSIVCFNHALRMDVPFDQRNISGWHQDTFNDEAYHDYKAGITAWIPILDVGPENGSLLVCSKSHNERVGRYAEKQEGDYTSLYYNIPESIREKFHQFQVSMKRGDLLLISMNLIHSSGTNSSDSVRLTLQSRYYPIPDSNFVPGIINYRSTKNISVPWKAG